MVATVKVAKDVAALVVVEVREEVEEVKETSGFMVEDAGKSADIAVGFREDSRTLVPYGLSVPALLY